MFSVDKSNNQSNTIVSKYSKRNQERLPEINTSDGIIFDIIHNQIKLSLILINLVKILQNQSINKSPYGFEGVKVVIILTEDINQ